MLISSDHRNLRPRPINLAMALPSTVMGVVNKAVEDVVVAEEGDPMPVHKHLFPKKRLTR
jgi:hypothetical protein